MVSPWGFPGLGDEYEDGGYALATQDLRDKEATTLKRQLSEFDSAVFGEITIRPARIPSKERFGKDKTQRIPSDRQSTRPLKVQVAEWNSAFLHLRVRGEPCAVPSQESGWQWHEPQEKAEEPPKAAAEAKPAKPLWLPGKAAADKLAGLRVPFQAAHLRQAATNGVKERRPTANFHSVVELATSESQKVEAKPGGRARRASDLLKRQEGSKEASSRSLLSGPSLPEPPDLRLEGSKAMVLPATEMDASDAEEVIAQHGDFEEIFSQHTDNWVECNADLSASARQISNRQRIRRGKRARIRNASEREEERQTAREADAGLPPREPVACAKYEAKAILVDSLWSSICPVLAPLLSSLFREPEPEHEPEEVAPQEPTLEDERMPEGATSSSYSRSSTRIPQRQLSIGHVVNIDGSFHSRRSSSASADLAADFTRHASLTGYRRFSEAGEGDTATTNLHPHPPLPTPNPPAGLPAAPPGAPDSTLRPVRPPTKSNVRSADQGYISVVGARPESEQLAMQQTKAEVPAGHPVPPVPMSSTMLRALMGDESPATTSSPRRPGSMPPSLSPRRSTHRGCGFHAPPAVLAADGLPGAGSGSQPGSRVGSPSSLSRRPPLGSPAHSGHSLLGGQQRLGGSSPMLVAASSPPPGGSRPLTPPIGGGRSVSNPGSSSSSPPLPVIFRNSSRSGSSPDMRGLTLSPGRMRQAVRLPILHP